MGILVAPVELKKDLGLLGSFAMGFADVGADVFLALGLIAAYAHGLMPLALIIASVVYVCSGFSYAELAAAIPVCGGASSFGKRAFGNWAGFIAGWGLMLDYTIDIALFAVASAGYLSFFIPEIRAFFPFVAAGITFFLMIINLFGIRESSALNGGLTVVVIAIVLALLALGFATTFSAEKFTAGLTPIEVDPGMDSFLYAITLAMVTFVGIESISQGAEETRNPGKTIPRATMLAVFSVVFFAVAVSVLSLGVVSWQALAESMDHPFVAVGQALPFAEIVVPIIAFAGFVICFVSANTGIIGVSRVAYSMSCANLITRKVKWLHPRFRTPWVTIIFFSVVAMFLAYYGNMVLLGELYAFGALTAYTITNLSQIALRFKEPALVRPFKVPLNIRVGKGDVSLVAVLGVVSCLAVFSLVALLHEEGRNFALVWFAAGIIYFAVAKNGKQQAAAC